MESFIVRIYRRDRKTGRRIVGIVEKVGVEGTRGFTDFEELRQILAASRKTGRKDFPPAQQKSREKT